MTLPASNPALPSQPNPYFQDNAFVRGDQQRANNGFIWQNLEDLDTRVENLEVDAIKTAIDYGKPIGEVFFLPDEKATNFTFDSNNPRDYFPAINLAAIDGSELYTPSNTSLPFITYMRSVLVKYLPGRSGEVSSWTVTVSGVTVTFPNTVSANAILAALVEDATAVSNGASVSSIRRFLQISGVIYTVNSSSVNLVARTLQVNTSPPSGTQTAEWYAYKNTHLGNQIEIPTVSGSALMAPNDPDGYFIMNLRTRGHYQGHWHNVLRNSDNVAFTGTASASPNTNSIGPSNTTSATNTANLIAKTIVTDGTNGTPLTRRITHGPAYTLIPYMWCGG